VGVITRLCISVGWQHPPHTLSLVGLFIVVGLCLVSPAVPSASNRIAYASQPRLSAHEDVAKRQSKTLKFLPASRG